MRRFSFLVFALLPVTAVSTQTVEERLALLESTVLALKEENAELRRQMGAGRESAAPTVTAISVTPGGRETKLIVGGFLQGQAEFGGSSDERFSGVKDRFFFRRARIYLAGSFAEHFEFKSELDVQGNTLSAGTGQLARANEIYLGWNRYPWATVRFGQFKPAFGAEQLMSDTVMPTIERYLGSDRLTDSRQLGMSLSGLGIEKRLGYLLTIGNGNGSNVSGNDNNKFMTDVRAYGVPLSNAEAGTLTIGVNAMHSEDAGLGRPGLGLDSVPGGATDNLFFGSREGWGFDANWCRGIFSVSGEYLTVRYRPDNAVPAASFDASAWHSTLGVFVVPEKMQLVVRREEFDPNDLFGSDKSRTWTFGVNWMLKGDDIKLMFNYLSGDSPAMPDENGRFITRFQVVY